VPVVAAPPAPVYVVNQGPVYSGPGITVPVSNYYYSKGPKVAFPYVGGGYYKPYAPYPYDGRRRWKRVPPGPYLK
jgi:hypothetical protein